MTVNRSAISTVRPIDLIPIEPAGFSGDDLFVVTCEHGGNRIPAAYRDLFAGAGPALRTHRGYDIGALSIARAMASALSAPLFASVTSRLLIDLNRSVGHPDLYSEFTRPLPRRLRRQLLEQHYFPYRHDVEALIGNAIAGERRVLHISCHSFTPTLNGDERDADIGLLYDPARDADRTFCRHWQSALRNVAGYRTRLNYPYSGKSDGFTTCLRRCFPADRYIGIELEINQKHVHAGIEHWHRLRTEVIHALRKTVTPMTKAAFKLI